ncbi:MAG: ABC transporter substrate-binding protein [Pseudomonadota bacterium]
MPQPPISKFALAATGLLAGLAMQPAFAQQDSVKIGLVLAKQGPFAVYGSTAAQGAQFAAEEKGMKALGRKLDVIWLDEANPNDAQQNMTKLVQQEKVSAIIGGSNSATALALTATAKREKVPVVLTAGSAKEITGAQCNRYTYRISYSLPVANKALGTYFLSQGKRWYFLVANYSFGQDTYALLNPFLTQNGGTAAGKDDIPMGTTDYSSFILKVRQANPDVVVAGLGGADYTNFLKQFAEYGLASKIPVANPFASDDYIWGLSPEAAVGLYSKVWHYDNPANLPREKEFAAAWQKKFNKPASTEAWQGWMTMNFVLAAIEKAGKSDPKSIAQALETVSLPMGGGQSYSFRTWDHQMLKPVPIAKAHAPQGGDKWKMMTAVANIPQQAKDLDAFYGSKEEIGCKMDDF